MAYKTIKGVIIVAIISILCFPLLSESAAPRLINFQGRLTDQQGNPIDGTYNIKFSIYSSPDPNISPLWTEEHTEVSASKGIVNVILGSIQSFDEPVKVTFDQERYLGITIDCDHDPNTKEFEMIPRQRILPAIYAYTAGTAYNADIADNADKLDGKDSSEFTTPEKDAGRPGVVQYLYEGSERLIDKYLVSKDHTINGDLNILGNVGIGTTSPSIWFTTGPILHVEGTRPVLRLSPNSNGGLATITFKGHNTSPQSSEEFHLNYVSSSTDPGIYLSTYFGGYCDIITFKGNGNVGIGTTSPSYRLHVNGTAYATGAAGALSDYRHKTNIMNLSFDALEVIKKLHPVTFEWKEPQDRGMEGTQIGFIAQEVENILPEAVLTQDNEEQTKGLKYNAFIPVMVEAIKAQQEQLEEKQRCIEMQQLQLEELMARVSKLEKALHP